MRDHLRKIVVPTFQQKKIPANQKTPQNPAKQPKRKTPPKKPQQKKSPKNH